MAVPEGVHVSTREAYEGLKLADATGEATASPVVHDLREILTNTPVEQWKDVVVNDFESSVFRKNPAIAELKADFYSRGAVYAAMSGSGSAVYGIFREETR